MSVDAAVRAQERFCDAGEFVVECFTADGETYPHVGSRAVGERIVRCGACARAAWGETFGGVRTLVCRRFQSFNHETAPDGFCAWGIKRGAE